MKTMYSENTHSLLAAFIESQGLTINVTPDKFRIDVNHYEVAETPNPEKIKAVDEWRALIFNAAAFFENGEPMKDAIDYWQMEKAVLLLAESYGYPLKEEVKL